MGSDTVENTRQPEVQTNLSYAEKPIKILDTKEKELRTKTIKYVKVLWNGQTEREATWELEELMRKGRDTAFASTLQAPRSLLILILSMGNFRSSQA